VKSTTAEVAPARISKNITPTEKKTAKPAASSRRWRCFNAFPSFTNESSHQKLNAFGLTVAAVYDRRGLTTPALIETPLQVKTAR
jgi:hypothetical protein